MAHSLYSSKRLLQLGQENYDKLLFYCRKLEKNGYWRQAQDVMKQPSTQVLDLYVQSVLMSLAAYCGTVQENQREYMLSITDTNPLDISLEEDVSQEMVDYARKTEQMPPILIQLCGVYDQNSKENMAARFMDAMLNVMLCMAYLNDGRDPKVSLFLQDYYTKISMFVQVPGQKERLSSRYIFRKLSSDTIQCEVRWLLESDREEASQLSSGKEVGIRSGQQRDIQEMDSESDVYFGEERETFTEIVPDKSSESLDQEQRQLEAQQKRLEEEQKRLAEEKRLAQEEKERLEREEKQAREEFQKVKKRLLEREKAEKEAQEKRIADLLKELNELVGLDSVKEEIQSLINLIKIRKLREKMDMPMMDMSYHMVFTGSPGTGKTTVARLVARIYKELGILTEGNLVETDRSRLVAGYVGQTAINVREIVERAIGGILFIDEAYSLVSPDTANDFGSEAVDTLVKMMEDHRDNLVVIVAGYTEEMKVFLRSNTGLISRFNKFISFDDYSEEQLLEILKVMVAQAGLCIEEGAVEKVREKLQSMTPEEKVDFGNARGVRNIFERMVVNQANRLVLLEEPTREELMNIVEEDALQV